ncbi:MAG: ATP-binding protein [Deltaproteobacteria bacterium]|jgi:hypothetical protein|nr:ATP-binding protein [Deltaproteobacteria bacterium]
MGLKRLPVDDPDFCSIIPGNYLYADKTQYIYKLITRFRCCFLSRPRRFGKTLLLDTIGELFGGDRNLFKGLWIDTRKKYNYQRHPVLRFSLDYAEIPDPDFLRDSIKTILRNFAEREKITLTQDSYGHMLDELLQSLYMKHGVGSVVLIDEYDGPVAWNITDSKLAKANSEILHHFFSAMKRNKRFIRFSLVTGVTRFAFAAMDSGPNNFFDISLEPEFAGICGFTIKEFYNLFNDRFPRTLASLKKAGDIGKDADKTALLKTIASWYDGYNWLAKQRVLNPYSIIYLFYRKRLSTYWPMSGRPTHISKLAAEMPLEYMQPKLDSYFTDEIKTTELGKISPAPILFHSGYLTIGKRIHVEIPFQDDMANQEAFIFKIPNMEVGICFKAFIFGQIFDRPFAYYQIFTKKLIVALLKKDSQEISNLLHDLLAGITFKLHTAAEKYYHSLFHAAFVGAGIEVLSETDSSKGQADMSLFLEDKIRVVIELKYRWGNCSAAEGSASEAESQRSERDLSSALDDAETAIRTKDYPGPFRANAKKIICLALAVRGRDEVAARFMDSVATLEKPAP